MQTHPMNDFDRSRKLAAPFVLVTGGKGGVGKTTVCANLGVQMAQEGHSVLLVDLDLGLSNLGLFLGVHHGPTLEDALSGKCTFRECLQEGPDGVRLLTAANGSEAMGNLSHDQRQRLTYATDAVYRSNPLPLLTIENAHRGAVQRVLEGLAELSREFDVVLGDSAAGVGPDVLHFAAMADRVLVVTTPEVAALTDAYGVIKALDQFGIRTGADIPTPELVVNQCSGVEEGQDIARKLRQVCERFLARTPRQAGWIPRSRSVSQAAQVAAPFVGVSKRGLEQLCLRQIAGRFRTLIAIKAPLACP